MYRSNINHSGSRDLKIKKLCFLLSLFVAGGAGAQDAESGSRTLEEIFVVAQKRTESAQDVPIALSAFSGDDLSASGALELKDISKLAPGVVFESTSTSSQPLLYVRGIGTRQFQLGSDPSVGVFVDGVYVARFTAQSMALLDVESVEILKGPQGTVYGRNTIGGAINVITRKPTEELSGRLETSFAQGAENSNNIWNVNGSVSGALSDNALFGLALSHAEDEGSVLLTNPLTGETGRGHGRDNTSVRGKLEFTLSDTLNLGLTASFSEDDNSPRIFAPSNIGGIRSHGNPSLLNASLHNLPGVLPTDPYNLETDIGVRGFSRREIQDVSMKIDWETDYGTVTSITSYTDVSVHEVMDGDSTRYNAQSVSVIEDSETWGQEFRLTGGSDDGLWTWLAGVYLYDDSANRKDIIGLGPDYRFASHPNAAGVFAAMALNPRDPFGVGIDAALDTFDTTLNAKGQSVFGQFSYGLTDDLTLTAGLRYTSDDKDSSLVATTELPGVPGPFISANFSVDASDRPGRWSSVDPMLSLAYDVAPDVMLYASYRTGFKSGGFQDLNGNPAAQATSFDPEELTAIEVGVKSQLMDQRLRFNASLFSYDYKDLQLQGPLMAGSPVRVTTNAADTSLTGLDVDIKAIVTDNLTVDLTYSFLDAEFEDYSLDLGATTVDFSGTALPQAPENKLNLSGNYFVETEMGELGFRLGASYTDDLLLVQQANNVNPGAGILGGALGNSGLLEESRTVFDASVSLSRDSWNASLFVSNLTNELYRVSAVEQQSNTALLEIYNQPRVIGVKFNYLFGE